MASNSINRPFLRKLAQAAGYSVVPVTNTNKFTWTPCVWERRHLPSEAAAWSDLEQYINSRLTEAHALLKLSTQVINQNVGQF